MSDRPVTAHDSLRPPRGLRLGRLLAEGGEGRVYEVADDQGSVYKAYRSPPERQAIDDLVAWPHEVEATRPEVAALVRSATAWPTAVLPDATGDRALGLLMPRAPERFSVRHRDGETRLATLSYLTADPAQRAVAYGLRLPPPVSEERVGLVYALARLLDALQTTNPAGVAVAHGDLSAKNVLWSLEHGPEVFVLDCDSSERYRPDGAALASAGRRRVMTPNWDDPAVPDGANPGPESDRYSLALIFLRVVGAAHFPIQRRQRLGEAVLVDFEIPSGRRRVAAWEAGAPIWKVCRRGLGTADPSLRPAPATWVAVLEDLLVEMGAPATVEAVRGSDRSPHTCGSSVGAAGIDDVAVDMAGPVPPGDVSVRPVAAESRDHPFTRLSRASFAPPAISAGGAPVGAVPAGLGASQNLSRGVKVVAGDAAAWWVWLHRRMVQALMTSGRRRRGLRRLAFCALVDLAVVSVTLFLFAMIVSPFLGI